MAERYFELCTDARKTDVTPAGIMPAQDEFPWPGEMAQAWTGSTNILVLRSWHPEDSDWAVFSFLTQSWAVLAMPPDIGNKLKYSRKYFNIDDFLFVVGKDRGELFLVNVVTQKFTDRHPRPWKGPSGKDAIKTTSAAAQSHLLGTVEWICMNSCCRAPT